MYSLWQAQKRGGMLPAGQSMPGAEPLPPGFLLCEKGGSDPKKEGEEKMNEQNLGEHNLQPQKNKKSFKIKWEMLPVLALAAFILSIGFLMACHSVADVRIVPGSGTDLTFVGLEHYEYMFQTELHFQGAVVNSLFIRIMQLAGGLLLALPAVLFISRRRKLGKVLTLSCLCLIPMCFPGISTSYALQHLLPREFLMAKQWGGILYAMGSMLQTAGFMAFSGGLFAYFKRRGIGKGAWQGLLAALLIGCLSLMTPDMAPSLLSNSVNWATTDTLDSLAFYHAMTALRFSTSAVASMVKLALQGVLAIIPAVLLCRMAREDRERISLPDARPVIFDIAVAKVFWALAAMVLCMSYLGMNTFSEDPQSILASVGAAAVQGKDSFLPACGVSLVIARLGGLAAGGIGYCFIRTFGRGSRGFGLCMLLLSAAGGFYGAAFIRYFEWGLRNTILPVVIRQMVDARMVGLMILLALLMRLAPQRSHKGMFLGLALLGAAIAWGDYLSPCWYGMQQSPVADVFHHMITGRFRAFAAFPEDVDAMKASLPVLGALTTLPALLLGMGGALALMRAFKKAE